MSKLHELFSFWLRVTAGKYDLKEAWYIQRECAFKSACLCMYMRVGRICGLLVCTRVSSDNRIVAPNAKISLISET